MNSEYQKSRGTVNVSFCQVTYVIRFYICTALYNTGAQANALSQVVFYHVRKLYITPSLCFTIVCVHVPAVTITDHIYW